MANVTWWGRAEVGVLAHDHVGGRQGRHGRRVGWIPDINKIDVMIDNETIEDKMYKKRVPRNDGFSESSLL